jgi:hypothetical protein
MLDDALVQTFPASDPVTLKSCVERGDAAAPVCDEPPRGTGANDGRAAAGEGGEPRRRGRGVR